MPAMAHPQLKGRDEGAQEPHRLARLGRHRRQTHRSETLRKKGG